MQQQFTVIIERDPESGWLVGSVAELPGCYTQAPDTASLEHNIREAIQVYLATVGEESQTKSRASSAVTGRVPLTTWEICMGDTPTARANCVWEISSSTNISARNSPGWMDGKPLLVMATSSQ